MKGPISVPVVMYHGVAPDRPGWLWNHLITPVEVFEAQMSLLREKGWNTITLGRLYSHMKENAPLPEKPVVLTFDDGYLDNWVFAYPILKKYGHHAAIWMTTDFIDPASDPRPTLEDVWNGSMSADDLPGAGFLSWAEMRSMEKTGHVEVQSHAKTHTWHFCGEEIVDFHRPAGVDGYVPQPWLSWNAAPEKKHAYMTRDFGLDIPWGTPVYRHERALVARRYFDEPSRSRALSAKVEAGGGAAFFDRPCWRDELAAVAAASGDGSGRYETDEEYEKRVTEELAGSRAVLSQGLGREVDFLCWPGGGYNTTTLKIAAEAGYLSTTTDYLNSGMKNIHGQKPDRINRIGCGSPWIWKKGLAVKNTDPGFFLSILEQFAGKKLSLWKMRWYKMKYLARYYSTGRK